MDLVIWVGGFALALATVAGTFLDARGRTPAWVEVTGPLVTVHTRRGRHLLERLARRRRLVRCWGSIGVAVVAATTVVAFLGVLLAGYVALTQGASNPVATPRNVLVVPGVNEFLPLSITPYLVVALVVGLVVHEAAHGVLCRAEDVDIDSVGVILFSLVPIGAFVDPDDESAADASPRSLNRVFAAGVTGNFLVALLVFALLFGPVTAMLTAVPGAAVGAAVPGSPADDLERGDVITAVDDRPIENATDLEDALDAAGATVAVETTDGERRTIERKPVVQRNTGPYEIEVNATITAVEGAPVSTERELHAALANRTITTLEIDRGGGAKPADATTDVEIVAGVIVDRLEPDSPLREAGIEVDDDGAPVDGPLVLTHVDGQRTVTYSDLRSVLADLEPGSSVEIDAVRGDERERVSYTVTPAADPASGDARLGVLLEPGVTGLAVTDFGVVTYPAGEYLSILGGDGIADARSPLAFVQALFTLILLPLAGLVGIGPFNLPGFVGDVTAFYTVTGPLAGLDAAVFAAANLLFWTGWLNVQLGLFNCLPVFPLDGERLLRTSADALADRLELDRVPLGVAVSACTGSVVVIVVAALVLS